MHLLRSTTSCSSGGNEANGNKKDQTTHGNREYKRARADPELVARQVDDDDSMSHGGEVSSLAIIACTTHAVLALVWTLRQWTKSVLCSRQSVKRMRSSKRRGMVGGAVAVLCVAASTAR